MTKKQRLIKKGIYLPVLLNDSYFPGEIFYSSECELQREKNGYYSREKKFKRLCHELAVKNRRKNKPELPNPKYPARIRKKHITKYITGSLYV